MTKKMKGAYYTPSIISNFIIEHVSNQLTRYPLSILEPSLGDGEFIDALVRSHSLGGQLCFEGVEKDILELQKAEEKLQKSPFYSTSNLIEGDFLFVSDKFTDRYKLIVGNPPYIKKSLLTIEQIAKCNSIHRNAGLKKAAIKNIWTSFLVKSCELLDSDGILAMVLPAEILQVKFSEDLREYLNLTFERTEIFTFNNLLFDCKGQDTIILFAYKTSCEKGNYFVNIQELDQLTTRDFYLSKNDALAKTSTKWSHHHVSSDDLLFLQRIIKEIKPISQYALTKPGIVTGANSFFIINSEIEHNYQLESYTRPIIQKGGDIGTIVDFKNSDFNYLFENGINCKLLALNRSTGLRLSESLLSYLKEGVSLGVPLRHKCSIRNNWFEVPNITAPAEGFFLKRAHHYSKLLLNSASLLITDAGYMVQMKSGFSIKSLVYSYYNSLTLLFSELLGRTYGGGVLELTPKEFQQLPMPYTTCLDKQFLLFSDKFQVTKPNNPFLNDTHVLHCQLGLNTEEVERIKRIRHLLVNKRMTKQALRIEHTDIGAAKE